MLDNVPGDADLASEARKGKPQPVVKFNREFHTTRGRLPDRSGSMGHAATNPLSADRLAAIESLCVKGQLVGE